MNERILRTIIAAVGASLLLAAGAGAAPPCAKVAGAGELTQPAGPYTDWVGPATLSMRGQTFSGEATVLIDPQLLSNSGPPLFYSMGFDWFTFDLGEVGSLSAWEIATSTALDDSFTVFLYEGTSRLGPSYLEPGVYGPMGSGMFADATGTMRSSGTMWMTWPAEPNRVEFRYWGEICGVRWE